ncbi:MAG: anti-sigma factor [Pseudomonadota bacterium]
MTADQDFDAQLSAYLDGELEPDAARLIEQDPRFADRLSAFQEGDALVATLFADELKEPVPDSIVAAIEQANRKPAGIERQDPAGTTNIAQFQAQRAPRRPSFLRQAASFLFAAAVGAGAAWIWLPPKTIETAPGWIAQVADYHRVYANEVRHRVEVPASDIDHIRAWLGERVGGLEVPDLSPAGLEFEGARLLVANGAPVAQLVYIDAEDRMFALCVTPRPGAEDTVAQSRSFDDLTAITWRANGQALVMIGPSETPELSEAARLSGAIDA